jgi:hypothetical protein
VGGLNIRKRNSQIDEEENIEETGLEFIKSSEKKAKKTILNYVIDMGLWITFTTTFITGILKFTQIMNLLGINPRSLPSYELTLIHDWGALLMGFLILAHLLLHLKWLKNMTMRYSKTIDKKSLAKRLAAFFIILLLIILIFQNPNVQRLILGKTNYISIDGVGDFEYFPDEIETVRSDIFKDGHFSIFDILVYLNNKGKIDLEYHFEESMNTYVIDSLNGKSNWWYSAYYDGGWTEESVFRMDHYPYKEKMYIRILREDARTIQRIYDVYTEEMVRKIQNNGRIIIPEVIIKGKSTEYTFNNVEVTPHNKRDDMFQDDVITAIDVIMSLGDSELITYEIGWYETVGFAEVKDYFVEKINNDKMEGRCGFVYEEGDFAFDGFSGNHIHIPSDIRVLNSPEYVEWFWICI